MSDQHLDPAGNTQQFRAFAQQSEQDVTRKRSAALPIIAVVVALAIIGVGVFLVLK